MRVGPLNGDDDESSESEVVINNIEAGGSRPPIMATVHPQ